MKHQCHCHINERIKKLKTGKLGLLGSMLIIGHLLFHVAECLIIPIIIAGLNHHPAEAIENLGEDDLSETTLISHYDYLSDLQQGFFETIQQNHPLKR